MSTLADQIIGSGYAVASVGLLGALVLGGWALFLGHGRRDARAAAADEAAFPGPLARAREWAWWRRHADAQRQAAVQAAAERATPVRHRRMPSWVRILSAHGRVPEPSGYGSPPPLVEEPTVSPWTTRDQNTVPSVLNPAVGAAAVPRRDRWEELDVIGDVLGGRMRAAANTEDTGLIEPVRTKGVQ